MILNIKKDINDDYNSCEGCIDNQTSDSIYAGIPDCSRKKLKEACPCKICLVKIMCDEACEEFIDYSNRNKKELVKMIDQVFKPLRKKD